MPILFFSLKVRLLRWLSLIPWWNSILLRSGFISSREFSWERLLRYYGQGKCYSRIYWILYFLYSAQGLGAIGHSSTGFSYSTRLRLVAPVILYHTPAQDSITLWQGFSFSKDFISQGFGLLISVYSGTISLGIGWPITLCFLIQGNAIFLAVVHSSCLYNSFLHSVYHCFLLR